MCRSRSLLVVALACIAVCTQSRLAAAQSDEALAERVLGPQWRQLSRRAGMIFAGTVLSAVPQTVRTDRRVPAIELRFRIDRPIAGVKPNQVLTIHEWSGATSRHRPMRPGQRILLFLYPPSRLGLTSPVGGSMGQIELEASGQNAAPGDAASRVSTQSEGTERKLVASSGIRNEQLPIWTPVHKASLTPVPVAQLERAIRAARGE